MLRFDIIQPFYDLVDPSLFDVELVTVEVHRGTSARSSPVILLCARPPPSSPAHRPAWNMPKPSLIPTPPCGTRINRPSHITTCTVAWSWRTSAALRHSRNAAAAAQPSHSVSTSRSTQAPASFMRMTQLPSTCGFSSMSPSSLVATRLVKPRAPPCCKQLTWITRRLVARET
jgi:hypothetical protein